MQSMEDMSLSTESATRNLCQINLWVSFTSRTQNHKGFGWQLSKTELDFFRTFLNVGPWVWECTPSCKDSHLSVHTWQGRNLPQKPEPGKDAWSMIILQVQQGHVLPLHFSICPLTHLEFPNLYKQNSTTTQVKDAQNTRRAKLANLHQFSETTSSAIPETNIAHENPHLSW